MGLVNHGKELLRIWDETPTAATSDCELVNRWATASGMNGWYDWIPYSP